MAGKIQIPETLKADLPQSNWGKILAATPIVMTVVATMLAGLASSEMTRAQYNRSYAAQLQSKAGDQWGYYQAKKQRSALAHNSLDLLAATTGAKPVSAAALPGADAAVVAALVKGELPPATPAKFCAEVTAALEAMENSKPDAEVAAALAKVTDAMLLTALTDAKGVATAFDNATKPINKAIEKLGEGLIRGDREAFREFAASRLGYSAARYDMESRLNSSIATIYELQVRKSNMAAEKHHKRSGKFFYGMLAAQMGVILSTFAIAARKRNFLWSVAAGAGVSALAFSIYVYLYI